MSSFYIYDADHERVGLLQQEDSVQWLEHYQAPGEVKVVAKVTPENLALLVEGNRIYNPDTGTAGRINHIDIDRTEADNKITVRADITSALLEDRVVMGTVRVTNVEQGMYEVYRKNQRGMPIALDRAKGYTEKTDTEVTWETVLSAQKKLAEISGLGFKVLFDPETGGETFTVYRGIDRSEEATDAYVGYFGTDVGNIENVTVTAGSTGFKNVAVVVSEDDEAETVVRFVAQGNAVGEHRREIYVDVRDIKREYQVAVATGEVDAQGNPVYAYETHLHSDAEYFAMLDARGLEVLADNLKTFSITCSITQNNIGYGIDYHLGDRIPVKLPEYGVSASARIASITMIYEREGRKIVAILSEFELEGTQ